MAVTSSPKATKAALAEQAHQILLLIEKSDNLTLELEQANATIKKRTTTIDVKEREGYDLQMQVQYKAKELMEMTHGWDKTKEKLAKREEELEEARYEGECWRHNYWIKEQEVLGWRMNTAATIRALQGQIEELRGVGGKGEGMGKGREG